MSPQNTQLATEEAQDNEPTSGKNGVQRRTNVRWKLFILLLVLVSVNYIDRGSISVALPIIQKEFNLPPELVGLLLSAFFWTYALMQIPVGWLIDKFGPRKVVTASCIGWGAATAASGFAGGFLSMFIARLGIGVTEAGVMPAGGKLNAIWMHKKERGRGATILDAGAPLGAGLGGILITWLIASTGSWRMSFILAGAATVLMGLAVWWYIRDNPRQHKGVNEAEAAYLEASHAEDDAEAAKEGAHGKRALLPYLKFRSFWAMCFGWLGFNGVFYGLLTWGPLYLAQAKGFDLKTIGWSTFVIFGAGFVGEILGGVIADKWRASGASANRVMRTLLGFSSVVVVGGLVGVTVVADPITAVVLLSVVLFFLRWVGLFWSIPSILGGRTNAGVLGGAMNFSGNIAGFVTPIVVGLIVGATGSYTWALLYFVGSAVVMGISVLALDYNKRLPV
ncbi:MFS transporter [Paenarthrobacter nitroguajacolicus]|uniref:MFS transporter n=1 Tax=Paenarthrobacter nitroguajacolicus TaxID=211146 RepID=UPI00286147A9|nr:MFS transporter [Paenarthrobacter nitroguajacolicus]MDR6638457.1 ACS family D-galactonate transporter-like MFS transporter [Paenarthrobacter nitroguajacolicus]